MCSIYCTDKDMEQKVKEAKLFHFKKRGNEREIISILKAVEVIKEIDKLQKWSIWVPKILSSI